jgi:hypothetical protein
MSVIMMFLDEPLSYGMFIHGEYHSLDDDVAGTRDNSKTFAFNDTSRTVSKKGLIRSNCNTQDTGIVTEMVSMGHLDRGNRRLVEGFRLTMSPWWLEHLAHSSCTSHSG